MEKLAGRVAVVTGGASGIGLGIAQACAGAGMKLALLDVEAGALEKARAELPRGAEAIAVRADVSDPASLEAAAEQVMGRFGRVDLLCNNAGVLVHGPLVESAARDWSWLVGVNLLGVAHGLRVFVPRIRAHGEGGHVVNSASIAGLTAIPGLGIYSATKFAVVALSETLREELAPDGIGVSVLCPGGVRTRIHEAERNRPGGPGPPPARVPGEPEVGSVVETGMDPARVGEIVLRAVERNDLYVLTHPEFRAGFEERARAILAAFERAAAAP